MERIVPLNEYVIKIASRCNLDCDYCYEYNLGDDSWMTQPKLMAEKTVIKLAQRIRQHSISHGVKEVVLSLHGGEPLMVGAKRLGRICEIFEEELSGVVKPIITTQTNGILLTEDIIDVIKKHNISVSVSLDGIKDIHDKHRRDHKNQGSYERVLTGIDSLKRLAPQNFTGLLCVIDPNSEPVETLDAIAELGVNFVDFLLPHHNWSSLPVRVRTDINYEYGLWYWEVFKVWVSDKYPKLSIRFLENIVSQLSGGKNTFEAMTLAPCSLITIATDGGYEGVDCLKSTGSGIQKLGIGVDFGSFDLAINNNLVKIRQSGDLQLASKCFDCRFKKVCAGGYFPHRWSNENGFDNPSVYCEDLFWLIDKIRSYLLNGRGGQN